MNILNEGQNLSLDFKKLKKIAQIEEDILPVVVQNADTREVIIIAYANQLALDYTLKERKATFWSTSRNELWCKGSTSGDTLELVNVFVNCEQNSLLYLVKPQKVNGCHTNRKSCFYRKIENESLSFHN
tara:strand:+ start:168 stop:554 length:387 start_codon:yes stop_codon:yes gene_type:complete